MKISKHVLGFGLAVGLVAASGGALNAQSGSEGPAQAGYLLAKKLAADNEMSEDAEGGTQAVLQGVGAAGGALIGAKIGAKIGAVGGVVGMLAGAGIGAL